MIVAGPAKQALRGEVTSQGHLASLGTAVGLEPESSVPSHLVSLPGSLPLGHRLSADSLLSAFCVTSFGLQNSPTRHALFCSGSGRTGIWTQESSPFPKYRRAAHVFSPSDREVL